ncbi:MAG TPA: hypothetical protein VJ850_12890 [Candidatus Limnocylindrales bacterium]|nr:hypothetical protein [Candidatus Limnocylindrales bacterium]
MGFLKRFQRGQDPVPNWASFLKPAEYREFGRQVAAYLDRRGDPYEFLGDGGVNVQIGEGDPHVLGLLNLAQKWNLAPAAERPSVIDGHLNGLFGHWERAGVADQDSRSFDDVAGQLRLRLVPDDFGAHAPEVMFSRPFAQGVDAALAIDWPDTVEMVNAKTVAAWGVPGDVVFSRGLQNVLDTERPAMERMGGDAPLTLMYGDSFYTASHALALERYITPRTPHGAVFAVPNRHVVLLQAITGIDIIKSIQPLIVAAAGYYREGPGSISPLLFWWRDGEIVMLPCSFDGKQVTFSPPDDFTVLLNSLSAP